MHVCNSKKSRDIPDKPRVFFYIAHYSYQYFQKMKTINRHNILVNNFHEFMRDSAETVRFFYLLDRNENEDRRSRRSQVKVNTACLKNPCYLAQGLNPLTNVNFSNQQRYRDLLTFYDGTTKEESQVQPQLQQQLK